MVNKHLRLHFFFHSLSTHFNDHNIKSDLYKIYKNDKTKLDSDGTIFMPILSPVYNFPLLNLFHENLKICICTKRPELFKESHVNCCLLILFYLRMI